MENQKLQPTPGQIPPFWIRPTDDLDQSIDPRVHELAMRLWPWAFRHVERELHDGPSAAETLEEVDPKLQKSLLQGLDSERAADILEEMDPGAAADVLNELSDEESEAILEEM